MSILNYFFIGTSFTFILDLILYKLKNHHIMIPVIEKWDNKMRLACVIAWPIAAVVFIFSLIKSYFKK